MELIDDRTNGGASFFVRTIEDLPLHVGKDALENAREDRAGVLYSKSGLRLLKCSDKCIIEYKVWEGAKAICNCAFLEQDFLKKIILPEGLVVIGVSAFEKCRYLENINLPDSVTAIEDSAFAYCSGLKAFKLPEGLTKIGNAAFFNCNCFGQVVELPESVEYIGKEAFTDGYYVKIPHTIKRVEEKAFDYFFFKRVYVTYTDDKESVDLDRIRDMFPDKLFWNVKPICEKVHIYEEQLFEEGKINAIQHKWLQEYRYILSKYAPRRIIGWEMQIAYDMLLEYEEGDALPSPLETAEEWLS